MDQYEKIQLYNNNFFRSIAVKIFVFIVFVSFAGFAWYYWNRISRGISFEQAKKIGNWELYDGYYVFQDAFKLSLFSETIESTELLDKKNGNEINILKMPKEFYDAHVKFNSDKSEDRKSNDELFIEYYTADNYAVKGTGKVEDGYEEVYYNLIENKGYDNLDDKMAGFLGRVDCQNDMLVILITNKADKYDVDRALDFVKKLKCEETVLDSVKDDGNSSSGKNEDENDKTPSNEKSSDEVENPSPVGTGSGDGDTEVENDPSQDSDGDGLSDKIEFIVSSDPNNPDSDGDGFSDFAEIKFGHNPQKLSPQDELSSQYYASLKEQIRIADEESYRKIFE